MEVLKGPHGSLFGANSGGALLINNVGSGDRSEEAQDFLKVGVSSGSDGLFHDDIGVSRRWERSKLDFNQAFRRSNGFREHSGMRRHSFKSEQRGVGDEFVSRVQTWARPI